MSKSEINVELSKVEHLVKKANHLKELIAHTGGKMNEAKSEYDSHKELYDFLYKKLIYFEDAISLLSKSS